MAGAENEYLTTGELADLLRIKERKVYDLAASGEVPCVRVVGKLLFPRREIENWIARHRSGPSGGAAAPRPPVVLGSHDPLLDWALKQSGSGLASLFDGSFDGLARFANGEGQASGLHIRDGATGSWNIEAVRARFGEAPVVLVEWARRQRGLILGPGAGEKVGRIADLKGRKLAARQKSAGSQALLEHLLADAGIADDVTFSEVARSETDAALAVREGKADAAFGLSSPARQYGLAFVPVIEERFDLMVCRRAWFEPAMQKLIAFCHSPAFGEKAGELGGYDVSSFGTVHFNGG
ncbi:MAG: helix-turn-helix transcriptional regulator [Rhodobiaceae bacterium]|nr:helix-turn-helix transcriptional regulator [Rhodobiaceae bacterium]